MTAESILAKLVSFPVLGGQSNLSIINYIKDYIESFNIVTADFVTAKVPIVASDDISWMPWIMRVSPTSHKGIVRKLKFAYKYRGFITWLQSFSLKIYNIKAKLQWLLKLKN